MTGAAGASPASAKRPWAANDIRTPLAGTFNVAKEAHAEENVRDVIGSYLGSPEKALVPCCDGESRCPAPGPALPGLPRGIDHITTATQDGLRHGTRTRFAAPRQVEGEPITPIAERRGDVERLAFRQRIDQATRRGVTSHLMADHSGARTHTRARTASGGISLSKGFSRRPGHPACLDPVQRSFRDVAARLTEGSLSSVRELAPTVLAFLAERNLQPKRCVWRASGEGTLRNIRRPQAAMMSQASSAC